MRIVLMQGGVETLDFFSRQLGDAFSAMGHTVFYHDLREGAPSAKHLKKFTKSGETVLFTEVQAPGKKRMQATDYLRGHRL